VHPAAAAASRRRPARRALGETGDMGLLVQLSVEQGLWEPERSSADYTRAGGDRLQRCASEVAPIGRAGSIRFGGAGCTDPVAAGSGRTATGRLGGVAKAGPPRPGPPRQGGY
jgi:hypothetical protein